MAPKRHTLEKIVRDADRQCAYIEHLTEEDLSKGTVRGRSSHPSVVASARSVTNGIAAVQDSCPRLSTPEPYQEENIIISNKREGSSSTCSDFSFSATPRRTSIESYTNYIAEYEAELSQPYVHLLVLAGSKLSVQEFEASDLATKHSAYETTSLLSVLQEEPTLILPVVGAVG